MRRIIASALVLAVLAAGFGLWLAKHSRPVDERGARIQPDGIIKNSPIPSMHPAANLARPQRQTASLPQIRTGAGTRGASGPRSEEHTSELQSHSDLVCRLLLE